MHCECLKIDYTEVNKNCRHESKVLVVNMFGPIAVHNLSISQLFSLGIFFKLFRTLQN